MDKYKSIYKKIEKFNYFMENNLSSAMKNINDILNENDIDFCFIGGSVLQIYGYIRNTDDIDILVSKKDKNKFEKLIGRYFRPRFKGAKKNFYWNIPKIKFEVIFSGEKAGNEKDGIEYINPKKISKIKNNFPILDLTHLIIYKLASGMYGQGRLKDFGDIQEIIKIQKLKQDFAKLFRRDLKEKYLEIWTQTYN